VPGVQFSVRPSILLGWTFPLGGKFHPWRPGVKLRMALWSQSYDWCAYNCNTAIVACSKLERS
jgi:hypothetical protein